MFLAANYKDVFATSTATSAAATPTATSAAATPTATSTDKTNAYLLLQLLLQLIKQTHICYSNCYFN
jgi:hypothetical protein